MVSKKNPELLAAADAMPAELTRLLRAVSRSSSIEFVIFDQDFEKLDESTLRAKSFLLRTRSKQRISPGTVQIVRWPDSRRIKGILFNFPKRLLINGSSPLLDDTDLIFVSQAGTTEIKVSFDPQKMVDDEGIDI